MRLKHGEPQLRHWRSSRHSQTPALEKSFGSDGLRPSATDNSGNGPSNKPAEDEIFQRRWRWIGHTLRKPMTWNPQGRRKRGRPRITWRHVLETETKTMGNTWGQLVRQAQDRDAWRALVGGLCSSKHRGQRQWWWWWWWWLCHKHGDNLQY